MLYTEEQIEKLRIELYDSLPTGNISAAEVMYLIQKAFINLPTKEPIEPAASPEGKSKTGVELIAQERQEQIEKHGYTLDFVKSNPEYYEDKQLATAALGLLSIEWEEQVELYDYLENWDQDTVSNMMSKPYKERLIIAGALIAAEIDRLNNLNK